MKVKIKQVNAYEITIGNQTYTGFTKNDDWRGMISFTGPQGEIIVADNKKPFSNLFVEIFTDNNDELCEFDIIQVSPNLIHHTTEGGQPGGPGDAGGNGGES